MRPTDGKSRASGNAKTDPGLYEEKETKQKVENVARPVSYGDSRSWMLRRNQGEVSHPAESTTCRLTP